MDKFSCNKCSASFGNRKDMQDHYSSSWHSSNFSRISRKMPPQTKEEYDADIKKSVFLKEERYRSIAISCKACKKNFLSQGAFETHQRSKKHRQNLARKAAENMRRLKIQIEGTGTRYCTACKQDFASAKAYDTHIDTPRHKKSLRALKIVTARKEELAKQDEAQQREEQDEEMEVEEVDSDEWEEDEGEVVEQEEEEMDEQPIPVTKCLFCGLKSSSMSVNRGHMQRTHNFLVPHPSASKMEALLKYLGEKVGVGHQCLECSKSFDTLAACRKHMLDKPHLAIRFEGEYDQFFDINKIMARVYLPPKPDSNDMSFFPMPDGTVLTHRDLKYFFRQRLALQSKASQLKRLANTGVKAIGHLGKTSLHGKANTSVMAVRKEQKKIVRDINVQETKQKRKRLDIGVKANKLQPHFRLQVQNAG